MNSERDITAKDAENEQQKKLHNTTSNLLSSFNDIDKKDSSSEKEKSNDQKKKNKNEPSVNSVSFFELFKYSSKKEILYVYIAVIGSILQGLTTPLLIEFLGNSIKVSISLVAKLTIKAVTSIDDDDTLFEFLDLLKNNTTEKYNNFMNNHQDIDLNKAFEGLKNTEYGGYTSETIQDIEIYTHTEFWNKMGVIILVMALIGVLSYISTFFYFHYFTMSSSYQSTRIRYLSFKAILKQEIEWHEKVSPGELSSRIISDTILIEDGIGIKLGFLIEHAVTFICCFIMAFVNGWLLSLEIAAIIPIIVVIVGVMGFVLSKYTTKSQKAYAELGGIAQEAFSQIRTIVSFGTEQNEIDRYKEKLRPTRKFGIIKANAFGIGLGLLFCVNYSSLCIAYISGSNLIYNNKMTSDEVFKVFMNIMIGSIYLSTIGSVMDAFGKAKGAASKLFEIIDRKPKYDKNSGDIPSQPLEGKIEFKNVRFRYPSRPDVEVLKGISFTCKPGQTVALIGASGSGKSTVVQLLEKFYNYEDGQILIDDKNIDEYNTCWLRSQIGLVSQEPTLFDASITENISLGCPEATKEKIETSAKLANAHDFILKLPNGYQTSTGERGLQLSGGQKQRICIARSLMNNPKILLLDEATSALDNTSEKIVQNALDIASKGRTTLIIAHRLTTIRNADCIIVMENGVIVESGTHDELMKLGQVYYKLVNKQEMKISEETESNDNDSIENDDSDKEKNINIDEKIIIDEDNDETKDVVEMTRLKSSESKISEQSKIIPEEPTKKNKTGLSSLKFDWRRFLKINKPFWLPNLFGFIGSVLNGGVQPAYAFIFGSAMNVFNQQGDKLLDEGKLWGFAFLIFSIAVFILFYIQMGGFSTAGEFLTYTLREKMYNSIIRQEVGFFDTNDIGDGTENGDIAMEGGSSVVSTGTLTSKLATDAALVENLNVTIGNILQQVVTVIAGYFIAFICTWKLTLILIVIAPFLFVGTYFIAITYAERNEELRQVFEDSSKTACEAIVNIKTVYALNLEDHFTKIYDKKLRVPEKGLQRKSFKCSLGCGLGNSSQFLANIAGMLFGSLLMESGDVDYLNMFRAIMAILFTSTAVGEANTIIPNLTKSIKAFNRVIDILDRKPKIDARNPGGMTKKDDQFNGSITFDGVKFNYPSRPNVTVLRLGKNKIEIPAGKTCAIVGGSGCGKSTLVGLLPRWYDTNRGSITFDKESNKNYNIKWLREQMGIVNQEPCLFNISIKENIRYGKLDATDEEIVEAAKKANIHDFVKSLPESYDTKVGNLGTSQMSGGQKQRIAIARAIIRNPKILLLDEATSALDAESELIVQKALERVSEGRTTVTIAHRLSTIRNADIIVVMKDGRIEEIGNHEKLIENKGEYYNMILAGDSILTSHNH